MTRQEYLKVIDEILGELNLSKRFIKDDDIEAGYIVAKERGLPLEEYKRQTIEIFKSGDWIRDSMAPLERNHFELMSLNIAKELDGIRAESFADFTDDYKTSIEKLWENSKNMSKLAFDIFIRKEIIIGKARKVAGKIHGRN